MKINVLQYLEDCTERFPQKPALADETNVLTYDQYMTSAKKIGTCLATGPGKGKTGKPVVVLIDRNVQTIVACMGCVYSGNFYVPMDPSMPAERRDLMLKSLDPIAVLDAGNKESGIEGTLNVSRIIREGAVDDELLSAIRQNAIDTDPLYAMFTSGSTGVPKGVLVSHRSVIDLVEAFDQVFDFHENTVFGNQAPFDFDVSVKDIYNGLKCGGRVEIIPKKLFLMPKLLLNHLKERQINTLIWAVSAMRIVADFKTMDTVEPPKLEYVMFSGEVMPVKSLNYWMTHIPEAVYVNLYGPTEITCNCTYFIVSEKYPSDAVLPAGRPFPNSRVLLLDKEGQVITKDHVTGEICVAGAGVALGYWNEKQKTAEAFVQNPTVSAYESLVYKTGDLAFYDETGNLIFVSRKDHQVKHMGHRIELGEIEAAINAIKFLDVGCCIYSEKQEKIFCYYQAKEPCTKEIVKELEKKLPKYMWPNRYVWMEKLPLNQHGKIDRVLLKRENEASGNQKE